MSVSIIDKQVFQMSVCIIDKQVFQMSVCIIDKQVFQNERLHYSNPNYVGTNGKYVLLKRRLVL